ncbi:DUF5686 and carboxypeptidase regulatory-like domain-containing protein [Polluticaenibacter yanchengensis]|uniref:DUF5686 and carboxypeptidase regulatory-like domain-containing protein n=1 Tax=Polluticaenibacter yanchengensis TaxID=3014562 RepID=A0ABT4UEG0_9BACT|nr:DUF5686 and carboxypeptidase regulatory-like domain-containing protein [Chitinophagaceae bacterium LY-5]
MSNFNKLFKVLLLIISFSLFINAVVAQTIHGKVQDKYGRALAYASVYVKGGAAGTTSNSDGIFKLNIPEGQQYIVCAFVGYQKQEYAVLLANGEEKVLFFTLTEQPVTLESVQVNSNKEDPAYEIIRKAINARKDNLNAVNTLSTQVYMKGMVQTYSMPRKIFGIKLRPSKELVDSVGKGILYFSESVTNYYKQFQPESFKEEVISVKVSGRSNNFGFNSVKSMDVNFYQNELLLDGLSSRGFVSPIANEALYFYKYKFLGTFYEDGVEINKIRVQAKRKFEPTYQYGEINIIEGSWKIHSIDMLLNKNAQIEIIDSLRIQQVMSPIEGQWLPQQTFIQANFNIMGVVAGADFLSVYNRYKVNPDIKDILQEHLLMEYQEGANKRSLAYWDSIRPVPLTYVEQTDYLKKDSLETKRNSQAYKDSVIKVFNRVTFDKLVISGSGFYNKRYKILTSLPPLLHTVQYNTVEGWLFNYAPKIALTSDTGGAVLRPFIRYGFKSRHFNAALLAKRTMGKDPRRRWELNAGIGKNIFQINPSDPINPVINSISTLWYKRNYMKIYEKAFMTVGFKNETLRGFKVSGDVSFEERIPLQNTDTNYSWRKYDDRRFTNNYPEELPPGYFNRHKAFLINADITYQPGQKIIKYPHKLFSVGSDYPTFGFSFSQAIPGILKSKTSFSKWKFSVKDYLNLKLAGSANYNLSVGGFFNSNNVPLPDWQHFNGNLTIVAREYVNSFQLAPYYANSTNDKQYVAGNFEWHWNGLLTNKIPLIRRFNWGVVTGSNAFYVDEKRNYFEFFIGIENILKTIRIDYVWGYDGFNNKPKSSIIIGFSGLFTGQGIE